MSAEPLFRLSRLFQADGHLIQFVCETWRAEDAKDCRYGVSEDSGADGLVVARAAYDRCAKAYLRQIAVEPIAQVTKAEGVRKMPGPIARGAVIFVFGDRAIRFWGERWQRQDMEYCQTPCFYDHARGFAVTVQAEFVGTGVMIADVSGSSPGPWGEDCPVESLRKSAAG